jgi:hypothetical protein
VGHETSHSISSCAKVKSAWSCTPNRMCIRGVVDTDNFTLPYMMEVDSMGVVSTLTL